MTEGQSFQGLDALLPSGPWYFIVVGAGIYGLPVAFFLARRGVRVLVLEDNAIPGECITVNTGGIIRISYSNLEVLKVAAFGRRIYTRPTEALELRRPVHLGFVHTGWGRFVHEGERPGILDQIERIALGAGQGLRVETRDGYLGNLTAPRRANLEKILDFNDFTHVLVDDDGGFADGGTALTGFLDAGLQAGVAVSLYSRVVDFVRTGGRVTGVVFERWTHDGAERRMTERATALAPRIVLAAGRGNGALVRQVAGWEMPTFTSFHQLPYIRNSPDLDFAQARVRIGEPAVGWREGEVIDAPVIPHWRNIYFRPEGDGLVCGNHHHALQPDDYQPTGGIIDNGGFTMRVGLDQVMLESVAALMPRFPVLTSNGLNLGRTPADIPGGAYY